MDPLRGSTAWIHCVAAKEWIHCVEHNGIYQGADSPPSGFIGPLALAVALTLTLALALALTLTLTLTLALALTLTLALTLALTLTPNPGHQKKCPTPLTCSFLDTLGTTKLVLGRLCVRMCVCACACVCACVPVA